MTLTEQIKRKLAQLMDLAEDISVDVEALELRTAALIGQGAETKKPSGKVAIVPQSTLKTVAALEAPKKRGGRPKGSKNKATLDREREAAAAQSTPANPGNDGEKPDKCPNCEKPVLECVCQRVQGAMAAVDKH